MPEHTHLQHPLICKRRVHEPHAFHRDHAGMEHGVKYEHLRTGRGGTARELEHNLHA